ncbi:YheC/YheD family protein [Bacillus sp. H-16]|uniref:YheC/YheD family endospore coat-associated protein n=1 Tax=Alteribacter salitolerans TaxID=2912333 RepID=UPI001964C57E|nr:YheC/YheD family protein [Alteribacter salitolerans]MBM7094908.1 YheC/YheD family protein [Alteribacter salitolerans]
MSKDTSEHNKLNSKNIVLHFGLLKKQLNIKINNHLPFDQIVLPQRLTRQIAIPDLPYESYFKNNHLHLGPVIGFMPNGIYQKRKSLLLPRFKDYKDIKGLIFVFSRRKVNKKSRTITGYYYDPSSKKVVKGIFPYPTVIFNRALMSRKRLKYLKSQGIKIFNNPHRNVNKYTFWSRVSRNRRLLPHLPQTSIYRGPSSVQKLLSAYKTVYLKPLRKDAGRGIYRLEDRNGSFILTNNKGRVFSLKGLTQLNNIIGKQKYLVQQEVKVNINNRKIDFRVYMQKGRDKSWKCTAIETKVAKAGSVITNSSNRIKIMPGLQAFKDIFQLNQKQTEHLTEKITRVCTQALGQFEKAGHRLGDVAFDIIIDKDLKIWLLEMQVPYAAERKAYRRNDERQVLSVILPAPFEYAKSLSGF